VQKRALAALLAETGRFRSAQELHAALRAAGHRIGLTTVYRELHALADAGRVDVVRADSGETLYRQCATAERHHHHVVCRRCGTGVEVEGPEVEAWAKKVARRVGYVDVTHVVELIGTCRPCADG
jgi:Fur family ferric uptake transcriptional regulator